MATTKETNAIECKVLFYSDHLKRLGIDFNGYGISIDGVEKPNTDTVIVEYSGTIGRKTFSYSLIQ